MSKDPAFLFYPADASEDTQFMNRLERGAYFDLVKSQRIFGGFTMVQLRKVLGADFETVKDSILAIMKTEGDIYFIPWVKESIARREEYSKKQSDRAKERWNKDNSHGSTMADTTAMPQKGNGNETVIIDGDNKGVQGEKYPFEAFWDLYDKKRDKPICQGLWKKIDDEQKQIIMAHVPKYVMATPDKSKRKDPQRYLRNSNWHDEIIIPLEKPKKLSAIELLMQQPD